MSDGRLALGTVDLRVQVTQAAGCRVGQSQQSLRVQGGVFQVVVQRSVLMVVCDEEELSEGSRSLNICSDEAWRTSGRMRVDVK